MKNLLLFIGLLLSSSISTACCDSIQENINDEDKLSKNLHYLVVSQKNCSKDLREKLSKVDGLLVIAKELLEDHNKNRLLCNIYLQSIMPINEPEKYLEAFETFHSRNSINLSKRESYQAYFHEKLRSFDQDTVISPYVVFEEEELVINCSLFPNSLAIAYNHNFCLDVIKCHNLGLDKLDVSNEEQVRLAVHALSKIRLWLFKRKALVNAQRKITQSFARIHGKFHKLSPSKEFHMRIPKIYHKEQTYIFYEISKLVKFACYPQLDSSKETSNIAFNVLKGYFFDLVNISESLSKDTYHKFFLKEISSLTQAYQQYELLKVFAEKNGLTETFQRSVKRANNIIEKRCNNPFIGYLYHSNPGF